MIKVTKENKFYSKYYKRNNLFLIIVMKGITVINQQTSTNIQSLNKELQEFEIWMKCMNYMLFLEHTHSNEYYRQLYNNKEGENLR
jgi:hypothetical protein